MIRRPPRSTLSSSSAASDVYKRQILRRLESEWKSVDYHVCNHNCNHFASHFMELLSLGLEKPMELPSWVNRIASGLDYVVPKRLATWFVRKIDGNPPVAVLDPRQGNGNIGALPTSVVPRDWYRAHHLAREPKYSIRLDGRMVEIKEDPAAASTSSGGGASAGTPGLPMASTSIRFPSSNPSSPLHGGREPPSPTTLARATFSLSLIHISEPTRLLSISYAVFCLKKKKIQEKTINKI
eukprot:TRINITY_DN24404_c0_g1_i2.p1 TRINITY_DN24404_c0_g1~~TRINITY_DN24404_c0_g1_i2.p1  ORF type:complete len:239 (-),score=37.84 TRINITY_DN24404_c0_g1_i2:65-781(-)